MTFDPLEPKDGKDSYLVDNVTRTNFAGIQKGDHWTTGTEPSYKEEGCPWYDSTNNVFKVYNGSSWDTLLIDDSTSVYDYGTSNTTGTAKARSGLKVVFGTSTVTTSQAITGLPFTGKNTYVVIPGYEGTVPSDVGVVNNSKSQCTLYEEGGGSSDVNWVAIGI